MFDDLLAGYIADAAPAAVTAPAAPAPVAAPAAQPKGRPKGRPKGYKVSEATKLKSQLGYNLYRPDTWYLVPDTCDLVLGTRYLIRYQVPDT